MIGDGVRLTFEFESGKEEQVPLRYKDASGWMNGWMNGWMDGWMDGWMIP